MNINRLLATCFGLGRLPVAPGTWGSIPSVLLFAILILLGSSAFAAVVVLLIAVFTASFICVKCSPSIIRRIGRQDPGEIVADEAAGQALTFLFACNVSMNEVWLTAAAGFILFRIFDILKPWPIKGFEKLWQGWGILADDLMAGIYAGIVLYLLRQFIFIRFFA